MSLEQSKAPNVEQLTQHLSNGFENDTQIDFHKSDLPSMEELRARAAIAAAVQTAPSGTLEVEKIRLTPQQEIYKLGHAILSLRRGDEYKFDLEEELTLDPDMYKTPAYLRDDDTQDNFGLTA